MGVFICYRRNDSLSPTGRIHDRLRLEFPNETIFRDIDSIPLGTNFKTRIQKEMVKANVFIAIIGKKWLNRRLKDPDDYVRFEIETALQMHIPIIPVLVEGASLPPVRKLPSSLRAMLDYHGMAVDSGPTFNHQMQQLAEGIRQSFGNTWEWRREAMSKVVVTDTAAIDTVTPSLAQTSNTETSEEMQLVSPTKKTEASISLRPDANRSSLAAHSQGPIVDDPVGRNHLSHINIRGEADDGLFVAFWHRLFSLFSFRSGKFVYIAIVILTSMSAVIYQLLPQPTSHQIVDTNTASTLTEKKPSNFIDSDSPIPSPVPPLVSRDIVIHCPVENAVVQTEDDSLRCNIKNGRCDLKEAPLREIALTVSKAGYKTKEISLKPDETEVDIPALELARWKGHIKTKPSAGARVINTRTGVVLCSKTPCSVNVSGSNVSLTIRHPNNVYCDKRIFLQPDNPSQFVTLVSKASGGCQE